MYNLVTQNLIDAIADAEQWEKGQGSYYTDTLGVCMKSDKDVCFEENTWNRRIGDLKKAGATDDDISFWKTSSDKHSKYRCILPTGHDGKCKFSASGITKHPGLKLKINDAVNNPGATGIFMNRAGAICAYPVMDKEAADRIKSTNLKNLAVRLERAATGYQVATGLIDTVAMASLIKGSENFLKISGPFKEMISRHCSFLKKFYQENYQINITNSEGFLCGPILPETYKEISIDQFGSGTGVDDYDSIQFTHVYPVATNKFMSRGLNVLFATKVENGLMLKYSLPDAKKLWTEASQNRKIILGK